MNSIKFDKLALGIDISTYMSRHKDNHGIIPLKNQG